MKILVTSFGSFLKNNINPSLECMNELPEFINGFRIFKCELPVSYIDSQVALLHKIVEVKPDIVISLGLAVGRKTIALESEAINLIDSKFPDNNGVIFENRIINENSEYILKTSYDLQKIKNDLNDKYEFISISNSAGTYVCNTVYYSSLLNQEKNKYKGIFIHLPKYDVIDKKIMINALIDIIKELIFYY